jgi:hypothetical protein
MALEMEIPLLTIPLLVISLFSSYLGNGKMPFFSNTT